MVNIAMKEVESETELDDIKYYSINNWIIIYPDPYEQ
jgi:hypothetical protein